MSARDTLLVVHNPYGYNPQAKDLGMRSVCSWLDWCLRPPGGRHYAIDCVHYKKKSYDGRIIAVLSSEYDWAKERATILRCLGAHLWKSFLKPRVDKPDRMDGYKSLIFEFNKAAFTGRRDHVQHFGYTTEFPAPVAMNSTSRDEPSVSIVPAALYPAAVECAIPRMTERLELQVPVKASTVSTSLTSAPQDKAQPPDAPRVKQDPYEEEAQQQDALRIGDMKVKGEPADDSKSFFARVKQELSEEKKLTVKNDPGFHVKREVHFADDVKPKIKPEQWSRVQLEQDDVKPRIKAERSVKQEFSAHVKREDHRDERRRYKREDVSEDRRERDPRIAKRQRLERR
ncbi:hypothetical protein EXIGLDRAFT_836210 [Exidia glandulosa HHB12029]|uniref:Uncharacterized protein n=1 Tax=Exidia glandulosa HHB12029 TaxID=1314781 RepID=A0A165I1X4_EXIGL|nr:hypothetical protein EXIGLDRAFT_836210 [Exidia glandulosa HHB12029]